MKMRQKTKQRPRSGRQRSHNQQKIEVKRTFVFKIANNNLSRFLRVDSLALSKNAE